MKSLRIFLLLFVVVHIAVGQTTQLIITQADKYFANEQYFTAIEWYKKALIEDEDLVSAKYSLGECYRLTFDYETAEYYYGEVAQTGTEVYPLAGFYYGLMKKLNGEYQEAIIELDKSVRFLKQNGFSEDERYRKYYKQARVEKEGCQFALNELSKPKLNRNFHLLSEPVNTEFNDYGAFTYQHDSSLVISSGRSGGTGNLIDNKFGEAFSDIFRFTEETEDVWKESKDKDKFSRNINTKWGDGAGAFNTERTKYYFTNCNAELQGGCFLFLSEFKDGEWTEPVALNSNVNKKGTNAKHPSLSPSGDTLFFTSDRQGGMGGFDIWYSVSYAADNWGIPQNMGQQVNTSFNEISPFFDAKENALFFASDGHRGFGGLDVFMAKGKNFLNPEIFNVGAPYNSNQDECFFMLGEKHGYVSSNRDGGMGRFDVYSFLIETDEEIISEIQVEEAIAGRNSIFSDDYDFDTKEQPKVDQIISQLLAAQIANVDAVLSAEDKAFFENLSKDDKERIDRIVDARYRNLAQSDLRALRIEDEFYYQELGREERQAIDQMILSRLEQNDLALTIKYDDPTINFYNSLPKSDKEKVDQFIAFKLQEAEEVLLSPETYNSLDDNAKRQVDNITLKYFEEKKNLEELSLNPTSLMFIRNLDDATKQNIYASVKEQIINLATEDKFLVNEDDRAFYQNLSSEDLDKLEGIATAFISADLDEFQKYITPTERSFYQTLNSIQKKSADRVLAKLINNLIKSDLYYAEVTLNKEQMKMLSEKTKSLGSLSDLMASITEPELSDLQRMEKKNQVRLQRFLATSADDYLGDKIDGFFPEGVDEIAEQYAIIANKKEPKAVASSPEPVDKTSQPDQEDIVESVVESDDDPQVVSQTPIDKNTLVAENTEQSDTEADIGDEKEDQIEVEQPSTVTIEPSVTVVELSQKDALFYDENEPEVKLAIDRKIGADYLNTLGTAIEVRQKAEESFKALTGIEKDHIRLLEAKMSGKDVPAMQLVPALNFYNSSAPSVKEEWNIMVLSRSLETDDNRFTVATRDEKVLSELSATEKQSLARIQEHRLANKRLIPDVQSVESGDIPDRKVLENLTSYNLTQYEYVFISGKLTDEKSGLPLSNFGVALKDAEGQIDYETYTDTQGVFEFSDIPSSNYKVVASSRTTENFEDSYFVRSLEVKGSKSTSYDNTVSTSLYFESGSTSLRAEGVMTLQEIATAYRNSKTKFNIELDGHTDNMGDEENNKYLSKERSQTAYQYLVSQGIPANQIQINFYGQNKPASQNTNPFGRQFNRRVEITLTSDEKIIYKPFDVYLIRPKGTLYSIAKNFDVEIEELRRWNGLKSDELIQAYKPLRIYNPENRKPNLDMLVELNAAVLDQGYRVYEVQEGDTWENISNKFNIPADMLRDLNDNLTDDELKKGESIKIYISY